MHGASDYGNRQTMYIIGNIGRFTKRIWWRYVFVLLARLCFHGFIASFKEDGETAEKEDGGWNVFVYCSVSSAIVMTVPLKVASSYGWNIPLSVCQEELPPTPAGGITKPNLQHGSVGNQSMIRVTEREKDRERTEGGKWERERGEKGRGWRRGREGERKSKNWRNRDRQRHKRTETDIDRDTKIDRDRQRE